MSIIGLGAAEADVELKAGDFGAIEQRNVRGAAEFGLVAALFFAESKNVARSGLEIRPAIVERLPSRAVGRQREIGPADYGPILKRVDRRFLGSCGFGPANRTEGN